MKKRSNLLCISFGLLVFSTQAVNGGYGDPETGYGSFPSWHERSLLLLTNACRMDPTGYRDTLVKNSTILLPTNYPPVAPLYWNLQLNRSARAHAQDMATNCGLQHNSCDGTAWNTRIKTYYKVSPSIAENIAYSRPDALGTMLQWILDGSLSNPAPDKSSSDGHRKNIMNGAYQELGTGYAAAARSGSSSVTPYWVQDFGGGASAFKTIPIPAGSHIFTSGSKIDFMANYYDASGATPVEATVVINGQPRSLTLFLGTTSRGTYSLRQERGTQCRNYYFVFKAGNGKLWRYPESGNLVTFGEGTCTQHYTAAVKSSFGLRQPMKQSVQSGLEAGIHEAVLYRIDLSGRISVQPERRWRIRHIFMH